MAAASKSPPKRPPVSAFAKAKTFVKAQVQTTPDKELIPVPGLARYAAVCAVEKLLKTLKETTRVPVIARAHAHWISDALTTSKRPDNFRGVEAKTVKGEFALDPGKQASIELRKRATNSPLKDEEVALLEADSVSFAEAPLTSGSSTFAINPKYESDAELMERVGVAISSVKGLPDDFIIQPVKRVVSEQTLADTFARRVDETETQFTDRLHRLMPIVTVMGVKPVTDADPVESLKTVLDAMTADDAADLLVATALTAKKGKAA